MVILKMYIADIFSMPARFMRTCFQRNRSLKFLHVLCCIAVLIIIKSKGILMHDRKAYG